MRLQFVRFTAKLMGQGSQRYVVAMADTASSRRRGQSR
jgi:hypothetical protein